MKHLLYIILLSLSFLSACKLRAEQKHREANDTIIAETPSGTFQCIYSPIRMYMKPALCNCLKPIRQVSWNLYPLLLSQKKVLLILTGRYV